MTPAEVPESVAIDHAANIAVHAIQRRVASLRIEANRWTPRPCPDDWRAPWSQIVHGWSA